MNKHNLAPSATSLRYRIGDDESGRPVVQWVGESDIDADELVAPRRKSGRNGKLSADSKLGECIEWLLERLKRSPGQQLASEIFLDGRRLGYSDRTVKRAKEHLPIETRTLREQGRILGHTWALLGRTNLQAEPEGQDSPEGQTR